MAWKTRAQRFVQFTLLAFAGSMYIMRITETDRMFNTLSKARPDGGNMPLLTEFAEKTVFARRYGTHSDDTSTDVDNLYEVKTPEADGLKLKEGTPCVPWQTPTIEAIVGVDLNHHKGSANIIETFSQDNVMIDKHTRQLYGGSDASDSMTSKDSKGFGSHGDNYAETFSGKGCYDPWMALQCSKTEAQVTLGKDLQKFGENLISSVDPDLRATDYFSVMGYNAGANADPDQCSLDAPTESKPDYGRYLRTSQHAAAQTRQYEYAVANLFDNNTDYSFDSKGVLAALHSDETATVQKLGTCTMSSGEQDTFNTANPKMEQVLKDFARIMDYTNTPTFQQCDEMFSKFYTHAGNKFSSKHDKGNTCNDATKDGEWRTANGFGATTGADGCACNNAINTCETTTTPIPEDTTDANILNQLSSLGMNLHGLIEVFDGEDNDHRISATAGDETATSKARRWYHRNNKARLFNKDCKDSTRTRFVTKCVFEATRSCRRFDCGLPSLLEAYSVSRDDSSQGQMNSDGTVTAAGSEMYWAHTNYHDNVDADRVAKQFYGTQGKDVIKKIVDKNIKNDIKVSPRASRALKQTLWVSVILACSGVICLMLIVVADTVTDWRHGGIFSTHAWILTIIEVIAYGLIVVGFGLTFAITWWPSAGGVYANTAMSSINHDPGIAIVRQQLMFGGHYENSGDTFKDAMGPLSNTRRVTSRAMINGSERSQKMQGFAYVGYLDMCFMAFLLASFAVSVNFVEGDGESKRKEKMDQTGKWYDLNDMAGRWFWSQILGGTAIIAFVIVVFAGNNAVRDGPKKQVVQYELDKDANPKDLTGVFYKEHRNMESMCTTNSDITDKDVFIVNPNELYERSLAFAISAIGLLVFWFVWTIARYNYDTLFGFKFGSAMWAVVSGRLVMLAGLFLSLLSWWNLTLAAGYITNAACQQAKTSISLSAVPGYTFRPSLILFYVMFVLYVVNSVMMVFENAMYYTVDSDGNRVATNSLFGPKALKLKLVASTMKW